MARKVIRHCENCGAEIFYGEKTYYTNRYGEEEDDGDSGSFIDGAGVCEECGKELCEECGEWEDGVCAECREKERENEPF